MRPSRFLLIPATLLCLVLPPGRQGAPPGREVERGEEDRERPSEWWEWQRAFPGTSVNQAAFAAALEQARFDRAVSRLTTTGLGDFTWTQVGPYNIGGRVSALAVAPGGTTIYLGSANGGVFKSTNSGVNWTPLLDQAGWNVFSIGAVALDPSNPDIVYVGTGEANNAVDNYDGNGLLRSMDGGQSWQSLGLSATARIARVAVDPSNPSRIFVAAMGTQFSTGPDRGLYRSEDGGQSWSKVLFVSDSTGATDVLVNPAHPETVFCATLERVRHYTYRRASGPECGIWRSADHGSTWTRLTNGLPTPSDSVGRIALGICASKPSIVYAQIGSGNLPGLVWVGLGMYRSLDGGQSWARRDIGTTFRNAFGGFCWYFGDVAVDPNNPDIVYAQGVSLLRSSNGGQSFTTIAGSTHVDQHGLWIDPANSSHVYLGNDGGFFWSTNVTSWSKSVDLPISQFYAGCIDPSDPNRLGGGMQDNSQWLTDGSPTAWYPINLGGDGFYTLIDPTNPDIVITEYQNGCSGYGPWRSTDGGSSGNPPSGITPERCNWSAPFVMDPSNHDVLLFGSFRVYKSTDNGVSYAPVSGDLTSTNSPPSALTYHTISTLDISPVSPRIYYGGTDDGRVWRSLNAGASWTEISAGLPLYYVTRVTADPVDSTVVYVCQSGFGQDQHAPRVFRGTGNGSVWTPINGNLPDAPANDLVVNPSDPNTLIVGTDVGVYYTRNLGATWGPLGLGMPMQAVLDLSLHQPSHTLVAATHGRSQWKFNLGVLPVAVGPTAPPPRIALTAPAPNPSRGPVRVALALPSSSSVQVAVFDATGRLVRSLFSGAAGPGHLPLTWDGLDARGRRAADGVYFLRASAAGATATCRLVRVD
jgi:photosystem II stability/assembly factor-like uncharacterized protein